MITWNLTMKTYFKIAYIITITLCSLQLEANPLEDEELENGSHNTFHSPHTSDDTNDFLSAGNTQSNVPLEAIIENITNINQTLEKIFSSTISSFTTNADITESISKLLSKPLNFSERSLLTLAIGQARSGKDSWDQVNIELEKILSSPDRDGSKLDEKKLISALKQAEKTGSFISIINTIKVQIAHFIRIFSNNKANSGIVIKDPKKDLIKN